MILIQKKLNVGTIKYSNLKMNLQEQLTRINEMMGNTKTKQLLVIQNIINDSIDSLNTMCTTMNDENNEYVSYQACDLIDSDLKVFLKDIIQHKESTELVVDMTYKSYTFLDETYFISELEDQLKDWMGKVKVTLQDYKNTYVHR